MPPIHIDNSTVWLVADPTHPQDVDRAIAEQQLYQAPVLPGGALPDWMARIEEQEAKNFNEKSEQFALSILRVWEALLSYEPTAQIFSREENTLLAGLQSTLKLLTAERESNAMLLAIIQSILARLLLKPPHSDKLQLIDQLQQLDVWIESLLAFALCDLSTL